MVVVTTIQREGICVLSVVGELDHRMRQLIGAEAERLASCRHLIVDLEECLSVREPVSVLLRLLASHLSESAGLAVVARAPLTIDAVGAAELDDVVGCYPDLADALTAARLDRGPPSRRRVERPTAPAQRPAELGPGLRVVAGRRRYSAEWL